MVVAIVVPGLVVEVVVCCGCSGSGINSAGVYDCLN